MHPVAQVNIIQMIPQENVNPANLLVKDAQHKQYVILAKLECILCKQTV